KQTKRIGGKKEIAKKKRNSGESYVSRSGKVVPAKRFAAAKTCYKSKCVGKCSRFDQKTLFNGFWSTGDKQIQDMMLISYVQKTEHVIRHKHLIWKESHSVQGIQQYYFENVSRTLSMKYSTYHRFYKENSSYQGL
ncbi:hypothetical protein ANN_08437, partial [Periplaneta americana]